ncbi:MAG TPA: phenylalanine--tRNA ligase subunit alpha [Candidatus Woesearchaeota archaeon]|nr:phenylalanine--tRNA ligase subunit alpha [Candidatus Woesearchaeota archaeon]
MKIDQIIAKLTKNELIALPLINKETSFDDLLKQTGLKEVELMRALQWLQNKGLITIKHDLKELVVLGENGKKYRKIGLPERRLLNALLKFNKLSMEEAKRIASLSKDELSAALGILKQKGAITLSGKNIILTEPGKELAKKTSLEEKFLQLKFPVEKKNLKPEQLYALNNLSKRKNVVKVKIVKLRYAAPTNLGLKVIKSKKLKPEELIEALTPDMLIKGTWKSRRFRAYDVEINVPPVYLGKKQPYRRFLDEVREKLVAMGFTEITGPIVETEFWDMDALFMPQFHSARDIHQAYYVKEPTYGKVDRTFLERVKSAHEKGVLGSKGWQYEFDTKRTKRLLLRTQGTACSARMLASPKLKIPGKYFGITRCFRYDVIDATHSCDFYQTEGIVVDEKVNLRHLFGLLKQFAITFAETDKIKLVPGYFPFTEPSVELFAKHPKLGWLELGGAGIFRPEVVYPLLGKHVPVLAWGLGMDRIAMFKLNLKDIRDLFTHDLQMLREKPLP